MLSSNLICVVNLDDYLFFSEANEASDNVLQLRDAELDLISEEDVAGFFWYLSSAC